jgi:hypothetical protein
MTPGGPEIEQHHLATLVLQAQGLPVQVGQLEIGGRLGLVYGPEAGALYERGERGRDNGLAMQEDHKPYHCETHICSPEIAQRQITLALRQMASIHSSRHVAAESRRFPLPIIVHVVPDY